MINTLISVIIPVYNVEQYLDRCLRSVANNTHYNLEIICVNDGSTDHCDEILRRYAREDSRFRIIESQNLGLSSARNKGLAAATGTYIAFIDADDWVHPAYFARLYSCMQEKKCDVVICGYDRPKSVEPEPLLPESLPEAAVWNVDQLYRKGTPKNYVWGKLYKAEHLSNVRFEDERRIAEDVLFNLDVFMERPTSRICYLPEKLYHYFDRADSLVYSLDFNSRLNTVAHFIRRADRNDDPYSKACYLKEALRYLLSVRYWAGRDQQKQAVSRAGSMLRQAVAKLVKVPGVPAMLKARYLLLCYVPAVYSAVQQLSEWRSHKK